MPCCSAVGCSNRSERGFRLFKFPANSNRRQVWITNCRRDNWVPTKSSFLCEAHFEPDQYEQNRADGRKLLKPFAVPTIFKHDFKPQKLKEQADYRPSAINNIITPPSSTVDHTYTSQKLKNPPLEKRLFSQDGPQSNKIPQQTIVELSIDALGTINDNHFSMMELINNNSTSDNEALENINIFQLWHDQSQSEFQLREDSFREMFGEPHLQNVATEIVLSDYLPPVKLKNRKAHSDKLTSKLEAKIKKLKTQLSLLKKNTRKKKPKSVVISKQKQTDLNNLYEMTENGNLTAKFVLNQALILCQNNNIRSKWSELSIKKCLHWKMRSPNGYDYVYRERILKLPSRNLLKNYIGFSCGDTILSSAMQQFLKKSTVKYTNDVNNSVTINIEEMCIKHCSKKSIEFFLGQTNNSNEVKLLCISLRGVTFDFSTLIGFIPVNCLDMISISKIIFKLIREVEILCHNIRIVQLILPYNMIDFFKILDKKDYQKGKIKHPTDSKRLLFFKYNPDEIIQQIYCEFLTTNDFIVQNGCISSRYLNTLQQQMKMDSYSDFFYGSKSINVVKLEKINMVEVKSLFAIEHCKSLKMLNSIDHPEFIKVGPTVKFIETMNHWLHLQTEMQNVDLEKNIDWLNNEVCRYMEEIEKCCKEKNVKFLSDNLLNAFKFSTFSMASFLKDVKFI